MILLSRVFKSKDVILDNNKFTIEHKSNNLNKAAESATKKEEATQEKKEIQETGLTEKTAMLDKLIKAANEQADTIIENAKKIADDFMIEAKKNSEQEILKLKQESQEDGFEKGYQEGLEKVEELKEEAKKIKEDALINKTEIIKEAEPAMILLITKVCEKILKNSLFLEKSLIINLIRQGLNETSLNGHITIRVSPEFYETVVKNKDEILKLLDSSNELDIFRDLSLKNADCIIETQLGNIDCSLDEQLKILKHNLYLILENR